MPNRSELLTKAIYHMLSTCEAPLNERLSVWLTEE